MASLRSVDNDGSLNVSYELLATLARRAHVKAMLLRAIGAGLLNNKSPSLQVGGVEDALHAALVDGTSDAAAYIELS